MVGKVWAFAAPLKPAMCISTNNSARVLRIAGPPFLSGSRLYHMPDVRGVLGRGVGLWHGNSQHRACQNRTNTGFHPEFQVCELLHA
jgi:hypothetical protein